MNWIIIHFFSDTHLRPKYGYVLILFYGYKSREKIGFSICKFIHVYNYMRCQNCFSRDGAGIQLFSGKQGPMYYVSLKKLNFPRPPPPLRPRIPTCIKNQNPIIIQIIKTYSIKWGTYLYIFYYQCLVTKYLVF